MLIKKRCDLLALGSFDGTRFAFLSFLLVLSILVLVLNGCVNSENENPYEPFKELLSYLNEKVPADIFSGFSRGFIVQVTPTSSHAFIESQQIEMAAEFLSIHGFKAYLSISQVQALLEHPDVLWMSPDREVHSMVQVPDGQADEVENDLSIRPGLVHQTTGASRLMTAGDTPGRFFGIAGSPNIRIAFLDTGIDFQHRDFKGRIKTMDFTGQGGENLDVYGHGTHVIGLALGNGRQSFEDHYQQYLAGMAPHAQGYSLQVLNENGIGLVSDVILAIDWVLENKDKEKIRVINLSLGSPPMSSFVHDPLAVACGAAVKKGIVVVAAAGNYGSHNGQTLHGGILSPAYSPHVIAVGAANTNDTEIRSDDTVASFSSRGPTLFDGLPKPDLVAPGNSLKGPVSFQGTLFNLFPDRSVDPCNEIENEFCEEIPFNYQALSGTSMAAPIVSGTVALMLQVNPSLTPNALKAILMATAQPMADQPFIHQGAGLINTEGAVRLSARIDNLATLQPGMPWTFGRVQPVSIIAGELFCWGQGVGWTGYTLEGVNTWTVFQPGYSQGMLWGQGVGWTGMMEFDQDPVFSDFIQQLWKDSLVDPISLLMSDIEILTGQEQPWNSEPKFLDQADSGYPTPTMGQTGLDEGDES